MPTASRRPGGARLVWEQGARVKFHYTQPDHAELILAKSIFYVSAEPGRAGHGLYATTVQPRSMSDDKLRDLLFARGRPESFVEGVVVLREDALSWERYSHRKYIHPSAPGARLDLSLALVGVGIRHLGTWLWSDGIFVPSKSS